MAQPDLVEMDTKNGQATIEPTLPSVGSMTIVAAVLLPATGLLLGMQVGNQESKTIRASSVCAKEFVVENPAGKAVARLGGTVKGGALEFFAADGKPRLVVACGTSLEASVEIKNANGDLRSAMAVRRSGEAGVWMRGRKGTISVSGTDGWAPTLRAGGAAHKDLVLLGVRRVADREGACLVLESGKGNRISLAAGGNGSATFTMHDAKGIPRVVAKITKSKQFGLTIQDPSGKAAVGLAGWPGLMVQDRKRTDRVVLVIDSKNRTKFLVKNEDGETVAGDSK